MERRRCVQKPLVNLLFPAKYFKKNMLVLLVVVWFRGIMAVTQPLRLLSMEIIYN